MATDKAMTMAEMQAKLAQMQAENEALKQAATKGTTLKVGESGAVSVYGLQRFPVSLHPNQWLAVFAMQDQIKTFIEKNADEIKLKSDASKAAKAKAKADEKLAASGGVQPSDFETVMVNGKPTVQRKAS